jgi:hypothetical protein
MGVKPAQIAAILGIARNAPPAPPSDADVSKQEAVRLLVPAIAEFRRKGYSMQQIADSFRGVGFELTTPTLKSYLSRVKASKRRRRDAPRNGAPPTKVPAVPTEKETARSTKTEVSAKSGKDAFLVKDKDSY